MIANRLKRHAVIGLALAALAGGWGGCAASVTPDDPAPTAKRSPAMYILEFEPPKRMGPVAFATFADAVEGYIGGAKGCRNVVVTPGPADHIWLISADDPDGTTVEMTLWGRGGVWGRATAAEEQKP